MTSSTAFASAASVTVNPDAISSTFAMPAVDGSNTDLMMVCTGYQTWISFGTQAGSSQPGSMQLNPGVPLMLTTNATTQAACASNPNVIGGAAAATAATATSFTALAMMRGGSITVTRGTASPKTVF